MEKEHKGSSLFVAPTGQRAQYSAEQSVMLSAWPNYVSGRELRIVLSDNWPSGGEVYLQNVKDVVIEAAKGNIRVYVYLTFMDLHDDLGTALRLGVQNYNRTWPGESNEDLSNDSEELVPYRIANTADPQFVQMGQMFWGPRRHKLTAKAKEHIRHQEEAAKKVRELQKELNRHLVTLSVALGNPMCPVMVVGNSPMLVGQFNHEVGSANAPCSYIEPGGADYESRIWHALEPHSRGEHTQRIPDELPEHWRDDKLIRVMSLVHEVESLKELSRYSDWPPTENVVP